MKTIDVGCSRIIKTSSGNKGKKRSKNILKMSLRQKRSKISKIKVPSRAYYKVELVVLNCEVSDLDYNKI
jgi:hypothetical protein